MFQLWRAILLWLALLSLPSSIADNANNVATPSRKDEKDQSTRTSQIPKNEADETEGTPSRFAIQLTSANFAKELGDGNIWLIEFYTPS
jgi:hypothetical protein